MARVIHICPTSQKHVPAKTHAPASVDSVPPTSAISETMDREDKKKQKEERGKKISSS